MSGLLTVRRLGPADAEAYRALCLRAYAEHPDAFTATVDERAAKPMGFWLSRVNDAADADECVFGALAEGELVGFAGLEFESRPKTRHKAGLFGMYVRPDQRGRRAGDALVQAVLAAARARPGVRFIKLTVTEGNASAEALYTRCGFERFGVEPLAMLDVVRGGFLAKVHMGCVL
ncbi:GNAT family N-acetyltransferase [Inhella gelatinilytica]|uniref:GNAT family N-acetyltransferase n=1 Tax=Inhella gelatinilytica TaxID=2795030 RepID=A0A931IUV1_9BURK|nr:GNAT family N-acetyltransferase [Inhella gelatinilytica]MBH9551966.1 GNAT family N-acetyltransferase [Inhella gelatinilytica]